MNVASLLEGIYLKHETKIMQNGLEQHLENPTNGVPVVHIHNHLSEQPVHQQPRSVNEKLPKPEPTKTSYQREIISLILAVMIGSLSWLWTGTPLVGALAGSGVAALFYWFTSKRRYMNMALIILGIFSTGASPLVSGVLGYSTTNGYPLKAGHSK